ncbi:MAG: ferritin family protein [Nitrospirota bacterium]
MIDREKLFDVFKIAIDKEHEAYEFYMNAAANTSNPDVKKLFEEFARVELSHEQKLIDKYRKLRETTI